MKKGFVKFCLLLAGSIFGGITTGAAVVAGNWMLAGAAMLLHVAVLIKIADMYYQFSRRLAQSENELQEARASNEEYRAALIARGNLTRMAVAGMEAHQAKLEEFGRKMENRRQALGKPGSTIQKGSSDVSGS